MGCVSYLLRDACGKVLALDDVEVNGREEWRISDIWLI